MDLERDPGELPKYDRILALPWLSPLPQAGTHPDKAVMNAIAARVTEGAQAALFVAAADWRTSDLLEAVTGHGAVPTPRNRRMPSLDVEIGVDPRLADYIRKTAGHYVLTGALDYDAAEVPLASYGAPETLVGLTARSGAGAWAVLPIAATTEADEALEAAEVLFGGYSPAGSAQPPAAIEIGVDGNGRDLNIKRPNDVVPKRLRFRDGARNRPLTKGNKPGRMLLALAGNKPLPVHTSKDTTNLRNALADTTDSEVTLEGSGNDLRVEPRCGLAEDVRAR